LIDPYLLWGGRRRARLRGRPVNAAGAGTTGVVGRVRTADVSVGKKMGRKDPIRISKITQAKMRRTTTIRRERWRKITNPRNRTDRMRRWTRRKLSPLKSVPP
jgi:hypothetical protein